MAGLVFSVSSIAIPAVIWLAPGDSVSDDSVGPLALLCLLSCVAAVVGLVAGIVGRHHAQGVVAIVASVVGGGFSLATLVALAMALMLVGMNAGL